MTITSVDELVNAMGNNSSRLIFEKNQIITTAAAGQFHSLWRATGQPGQGAIPTAVATCDNTLTGAAQFNQQTAPATSYLAIIDALCTVQTTLELHDRLAHMGGLVGNVTTAQTVGLDLSTLLASDNIDVRKGDANYSDVQWWLEWYADTGSTASTATVNVTYDDGSSGNLTGISLAATRRGSQMFPLNSSIPAADSGKYIRDVNTVTLSASTGTAGNFGVTATRYRAGVYLPVGNQRFTSDWAQLGLPEIPNESCLFLIQMAAQAQPGTVRTTGKVVHG